jgi:hypothetical protein
MIGREEGRHGAGGLGLADEQRLVRAGQHDEAPGAGRGRPEVGEKRREGPLPQRRQPAHRVGVGPGGRARGAVRDRAVARASRASPASKPRAGSGMGTGSGAS